MLAYLYIDLFSGEIPGVRRHDDLELELA
jgi:hypothetical protein